MSRKTEAQRGELGQVTAASIQKKRPQDSMAKALKHFGAIKDRLDHPTAPSLLTFGRKKAPLF